MASSSLPVAGVAVLDGVGGVQRLHAGAEARAGPVVRRAPGERQGRNAREGDGGEKPFHGGAVQEERPGEERTFGRDGGEREGRRERPPFPLCGL